MGALETAQPTPCSASADRARRKGRSSVKMLRLRNSAGLVKKRYSRKAGLSTPALNQGSSRVRRGPARSRAARTEAGTASPGTRPRPRPGRRGAYRLSAAARPRGRRSAPPAPARRRMCRESRRRPARPAPRRGAAHRPRRGYGGALDNRVGCRDPSDVAAKCGMQASMACRQKWPEPWGSGRGGRETAAERTREAPQFE